MARGYELELPEWEEELGGLESGGAEFEAAPYDFSEFEEEAAPFNTQLAEQAQMPSALVRQKVQQHQIAHAQLMSAIWAMGRHVVRRNGGFHFTLPARSPAEVAAKLRIAPHLAVSLLNSMKHRNAQLRAGQSSTSELELENGPPCPGRTGVEISWWGVRIWLNECHTRILLGALTAGGGLGALCSMIAQVPQVRLVCGILPVVGAIGVGAINIIDGMGGSKGIVISRLWIMPEPLPRVIVWHQ